MSVSNIYSSGSGVLECHSDIRLSPCAFLHQMQVILSDVCSKVRYHPQSASVLKFVCPRKVHGIEGREMVKNSIVKKNLHLSNVINIACLFYNFSLQR